MKTDDERPAAQAEPCPVPTSFSDNRYSVAKSDTCDAFEPEDFGLVAGCDEPDCDADGEVLAAGRLVCREHAPQVDDATLDLFEDEPEPTEPYPSTWLPPGAAPAPGVRRG